MVPDDENADALVRRNFAFIDLCGFTSLTDEHGVGEAVAALSTFRAVVRERAGWRGVRVAKWLGDGAMLVATEPRPLLDAVLRMEQALDAAAARCPCVAASPPAGSSSSRATTTSAGRSTWPPACATRPTPIRCWSRRRCSTRRATGSSTAASAPAPSAASRGQVEVVDMSEGGLHTSAN